MGGTMSIKGTGWADDDFDGFEELSDELLLGVAGGADPGYEPTNNGLGRVGPGTRMRWLGNYYTPEALAHDRAVRGNLQNGSSHFMAHAKALPLLPRAAASYFRARFRPGPDDVHLPNN
jgi:hypothetical protein